MNTPTNRPLASRSLPIRVPRVCVALVGSDPAEMIDKAEGLVRENWFFEFRLDYLKDPAAGVTKIKRFLDMHPGAICIATCRRVVNGGKFKGSAGAELAILAKAAAAGFQFVDLELETAEALKSTEYDKLRSTVGVVLSFHDFKATRKLDETFERMKVFAADFYKVVSTATRLYDNVVMMKFLEAKSHTHSMVGMCMGEQGIMSRILGLRAGSVFTFASATPGEETAPGQVAFRTLRDTYRVEFVDAATRVYGVAGDPVAHSLSPVMMNTAFRRETVNAVYLALHAKSLEDLMECMRNIPISGISVTMPYKEEIVKFLDGSDVLTERTGACNTVVRAQNGKLFGYNTDVAGVIGPLEQRLSLNGAKVLVIGAGGAARSAVFGIKSRGADVYIINRTPANGQKLAREAKAKYINRADLKKYTFDVIINATPAGMHGDRSSPLTDKELRAKYLFEMVYSEETPLAKLARSQGITVIPGTEMFVAQAVRQFEIWTGKPAPVADMAYAVKSALGLRAAAAGPTTAEEPASVETKVETKKVVAPPAPPKALATSQPKKPTPPRPPAPRAASKSTSSKKVALKKSTPKKVAKR